MSRPAIAALAVVVLAVGGVLTSLELSHHGVTKGASPRSSGVHNGSPGAGSSQSSPTASKRTPSKSARTPSKSVPTPSKPTPRKSARSASSGSRWLPRSGDLPWQWELDHPLCNGGDNLSPTETAALIAATVANPATSSSCAQDLGLGDVASNGEKPPSTNPVVYDIDGFDNTGTDNADEASSLGSSDSPVVKELHKLGDHVICYVDVGTAENWRPDYSKFPAAALGSDNGWPGERWLDIAPGPDLSAVESIMMGRFQMCADNGFDAVEPDNMDGAENDTGFTISISGQIAYDKWVANAVHALGMSVAQKNFEDQSASLEPYFDFSIEEQCFQYNDCSDLVRGPRS
jgi:hypothetical protein